MGKYFFLLPAVILLLSGCNAYRIETDIAQAPKISNPEYTFYIRPPALTVNPKMRGEMTGDFLNPAYPQNMAFDMEQKEKYPFLSFWTPAMYLPDLKKINDKAHKQFPKFFAENPQHGIPIELTISLDKFHMKAGRENNQIGGYSLGFGEKLDFTLQLMIEDTDFKKHPIFLARFSIQQQTSQSINLTKVFSDLSGMSKEYYTWPLFSPDIFSSGGQAGEYKDFLENAILHLLIAKLYSKEYSVRMKELWQTRKEAVAEEKIDRHFGLVIGISQYQSPQGGLCNLAFADKDAEAMAKLFQNDLNWPSSRILKLVNQNATRENIIRAIEKIASQLKENDLLTVYWSGHGFSRQEQIYLACYDTDVNRPESALPMAALRNMLNEKKIRNVIFIGDTCHAGGILTGGRGLSVNSYHEAISTTKQKNGGWIFMLAAESDRQAVEDKRWGHGAFTYCLLKGFQGEADGYEGAGNRDNIITPAELRAYLTVKVPMETQNALGSAVHPLVGTDSANPQIWNMNIYEE